jgi:DNA-binding response OmpR family regulator
MDGRWRARLLWLGMTAAPDARPLILVVDDDRDLRELLASLLEDEGYRTSTAVDGVDALEAARRDNPALILVDATMPRLDGAAFCRSYRDDGGTAPVILISAGRPEQIMVAVEACGAAAFIAKPFAIEEVVDTVARCIEG